MQASSACYLDLLEEILNFELLNSAISNIYQTYILNPYIITVIATFLKLFSCPKSTLVSLA